MITNSMKLLTFNRNYFGFTILLLIVEIFIALYVHDAFVRPYVGDILVAILIYCFIKSFVTLPALPVAVSVLLFTFAIEFVQ